MSHFNSDKQRALQDMLQNIRKVVDADSVFVMVIDHGQCYRAHEGTSSFDVLLQDWLGAAQRHVAQRDFDRRG
ncbi:hypothetical protein GCM10028796_47060 [Ramlibacter monticola]|uniref:Uncharacterized protein n=1 Tax=Ramlibacter monticola TaxID=1926872 RepID=A0A936Z697_9BURK|nr:hypothetical protein [Ramlibacter monticola]MBL0394330.1 hypothetical protein [Ramlibacter monticola]